MNTMRHFVIQFEYFDNKRMQQIFSFNFACTIIPKIEDFALACKRYLVQNNFVKEEYISLSDIGIRFICPTGTEILNGEQNVN